MPQQSRNAFIPVRNFVLEKMKHIILYYAVCVNISIEYTVDYFHVHHKDPQQYAHHSASETESMFDGRIWNNLCCDCWCKLRLKWLKLIDADEQQPLYLSLKLKF